VSYNFVSHLTVWRGFGLVTYPIVTDLASLLGGALMLSRAPRLAMDKKMLGCNKHVTRLARYRGVPVRY
jgi:hypothetical protein